MKSTWPCSPRRRGCSKKVSGRRSCDRVDVEPCHATVPADHSTSRTSDLMTVWHVVMAFVFAVAVILVACGQACGSIRYVEMGECTQLRESLSVRRRTSRRGVQSRSAHAHRWQIRFAKCREELAPSVTRIVPAAPTPQPAALPE